MIEITDYHAAYVCMQRSFLLPNNMTFRMCFNNNKGLLSETDKELMGIILASHGFTYSTTDDTVAWNQPMKVLELYEIRKIKDDNALAWSAIQHNQLPED